VNFNLLNTPFAGPGFTYGNLLCSFLMAPYDGGCEGYGGSPGLPGAGTGKFPYLFPDIGVQSGANAFGLPGSQIDTSAVSAFATATYKITDAFALTADLRWDQSQKHLVYSQGPLAGLGGNAVPAAYLDPLFAQIFPPFSTDETKTFDNVAPSVTLKYNFEPVKMVYATFAEGFRAGGFNVSTEGAQYLPYGPEKAYNFELGTKTIWLDGKVSANADVFYMIQSDLVEPETEPNVPAFLDLYYLGNVGTAHTYGAEFQGVWRPVRWLDLGATAGWLDDHIVSGSSHGVSLVGQAIPLTRNWTINLTGDVDYPLSNSVSLVGNIDYRLEYGGWLPASYNTLETTPYQDFESLDADVGLKVNRVRVSLFVNNAFNDIIPQFQYADRVENVNEGRTYGIRVEAKF